MSRKSDISQEPIDDFTSKVIFILAFFAIIDHFWCQIINCPVRNINVTTHEMNIWCFEANQIFLKKIHCVHTTEWYKVYLNSPLTQ